MEGPLGSDLEAFVDESVVPSLRTLSEEEYLEGPAAILLTAARFRRYQRALDRANALHQQLERGFEGDEAARERWLARCKKSALWRGVPPR